MIHTMVIGRHLGFIRVCMKMPRPGSEAGGSCRSTEGSKLEGFVWEPEVDPLRQNPHYPPTRIFGGITGISKFAILFVLTNLDQLYSPISELIDLARCVKFNP